MWNIHTAILETKHLEEQENGSVKYNSWQEDLKADLGSTDCLAQSVSMKDGQMTGLY